jgi:caffeoyl-CoA O-methyltransferase
MKSADNFQRRLDQYLLRLTPGRDRHLREMERLAARRGFPIVGPLVGRFLYQLATGMRASRVLEFGSGFGYSAYWFALAMGKTGKVTLIDGDPANLARAEACFERAALPARFIYHAGDALEVAARLNGTYDIVFNDIDKEAYPQTIDPAARLLRPGGVFITDNVLWSGRVFDSSADPATEGIRAFTRKLYRDRRFFTTIVPLRDGLAVATRI